MAGDEGWKGACTDLHTLLPAPPQRNILRELDHGAGALAPGSTVVFVNDHDEETSLQAATQRVGGEGGVGCRMCFLS